MKTLTIKFLKLDKEKFKYLNVFQDIDPSIKAIWEDGIFQVKINYSNHISLWILTMQ